MNPFSGIINSTFLQIYKDAIDAILENGSLSIPCSLKFGGTAEDYCNNCVYDMFTKVSANIYNNTGPSPFPDHTICPVCMGMGIIKIALTSETLYLATLFDSKYFLNTNKLVNIPDGTIQTICSSIYIPKIRSAVELSIVDTDKYGNYFYERMNDPMFVGLGNTDYIFTTWKRK